jgi:hypothetical protein
MCKPHSNQYTNALRNVALARKGAEVSAPEPEPGAAPEPVPAKRGREVVVSAANAQGDAGQCGRATPTLGPRAPVPGLHAFGRVVGHAEGRHATPAPRRARGQRMSGQTAHGAVTMPPWSPATSSCET